jgi:hypothetical protein
MASDAKDIIDTTTILDHVSKRQKASQMLLLAIVDKKSRTAQEVSNILVSCISELKKKARSDFYFDLGWLETSESVLDNLTSLNWVAKHRSVITYNSTEIGKAQLEQEMV